MTPVIIDTREPFEYESSHAKGAINIPSTKFMNGVPDKLKDMPHDQPLVLYCRSGQRSNTCIQILRMNGFSDLTNGINEHQVSRFIKAA